MAITFCPHLWYAKDAEAAARFYVGIVPNSSVDRVTIVPAETPAGPAGSVHVVEFTLAGSRVMAITAGPHHEFNDAVSMVLTCDTQDEIDWLWSELQQGGGQPVNCGWLIDRFGLRWQIVPRRLGEMMSDPDRLRAGAAAVAMLGMIKLDIAALEAAFNQ